MENVNVTESKKFLNDILHEMSKQDPVHAKTLRDKRYKNFGNESLFNYLRNTIYRNFYILKVDAITVAQDYLLMIEDMRREMKYFLENEKYSCKNEKEAYERVYSNPGIMRYYLNALMISQILWEHHFNMLEWFVETLPAMVSEYNTEILDIGAGHGLHSMIVRDYITGYKKIDFIDISEKALEILRKIHGFDRIEYHTVIPDRQYDLVILSEVLEHTEDPLKMLKELVPYMKSNGKIFIVVPTNAPAIDHIYLFRNEFDVHDMINRAGLYDIADTCIIADRQTELIGLFCVKK